MDETPLSLNGKTVYAWACSGNDSIAYKLATSRSSEIIKMYYSDILDKLITCDGYAGYNIFYNIRGAGHILRESKDASEARPTGNIT